MSNYPIYLVDDEDAVRRSIGFLLKTSGHHVAAFENGKEFLKQSHSLDPGCVLLDVQMPEINGLQVQEELHDAGIAFPVVVMTGHGDIEVAVRAMKAGAVDFIEKPFAKEEMLAAIEQAFIRLDHSDALSRRREEAQLLLNGLTPRERDVLNGLAKGHPNKTIGYDLGISSRTVEIFRANLMKKLNVHSLADLLRIAFAAGVGDDPMKDNITKTEAHES